VHLLDTGFVPTSICWQLVAIVSEKCNKGKADKDKAVVRLLIDPAGQLQ